MELTAGMSRASGLHTAAFDQLPGLVCTRSDGATAALSANVTLLLLPARAAVVVSCLGMHWVNDVPVSG